MSEILRLIKNEVCMGTYGLVELELRKLVEENGSSHNSDMVPCKSNSNELTYCNAVGRYCDPGKKCLIAQHQ